MRLYLAIALMVLLGVAAPAEAHLLNMSRVAVSLEDGGTVEVELELDLLRTAEDRASYFALSQRPDPMNDGVVREVLAALPESVELVVAQARVEFQLVEIAFANEPESVYLDPFSWPRARLRLRGVLPRPVSAANNTLLDLRFTDLFFFEEPIATTVIDTTTGASKTRWLVTGQRLPSFDAAAWLGRSSNTAAERTEVLAQLWTYLVAGVRHIIPDGFDHLLFVAGLFLVAQSIRQLIAFVSLFTLAHTVTLISAALGWVAIPAMVVEPLVLASIIWIGIVNLRAKHAGTSSGITVFVFGLLHGFGFAGAIRELTLPADQTISALVSFNVGVEIGQLAFLLLLFCITKLAVEAPTPPARPALRRLGGAAILGVSSVYVLSAVFFQ
ncbi:MAG: HupE/UreJ family protein [Pseudomonadota bacterium]